MRHCCLARALNPGPCRVGCCDRNASFEGDVRATARPRTIMHGQRPDDTNLRVCIVVVDAQRPPVGCEHDTFCLQIASLSCSLNAAVPRALGSLRIAYHWRAREDVETGILFSYSRQLALNQGISRDGALPLLLLEGRMNDSQKRQCEEEHYAGHDLEHLSESLLVCVKRNAARRSPNR